MDCTGTTGIRINVDTSEMKRKIAEKKENFRNSLSWSSSTNTYSRPRSFEAGLKLGVRPKTDDEIYEAIRENERIEAVRKQQKEELFRLNEKTMEWVPPETDTSNREDSSEHQNNETTQTAHDIDCMQSFCLYLKLQLSQFSHFSVRTVSPDFDTEENEANRHVVVEDEEQPQESASPQTTPPPVRSHSRESSQSRHKKRRDSGLTFGFGSKRSKKKSGGSISPVASDNEGEKQDYLEIEEKIEQSESSKVDSDTTSSLNFIEDFWETTKEAYEVQKSGAETLIDTTRKEVNEGTSTFVDKTMEMKDKTLEKTKDAANDVYDKTVEIGDATLQKTKDGATFVVDKTKAGATVVVDKTKKGASVAVDKTMESAAVVVDKTVEGATVVVDKTVEGAAVVVDKTAESANVVVDKTIELANKSVEVVDDATKDIPVHPVGKRKETPEESEDVEAEVNDHEVVSSDAKDQKESLQHQSETVDENDVMENNRIEPTNKKSSKKKRRKSSVIAFGFGNKNKKKGPTKSSEKPLSESSPTSS